ncbi:MAG: MBL fold metallo-hydrolase [Anaerolineales bacterium]|nr:MBL fold metallo-hydrolase [Anaerolineales bacterium]
MRIHFHGAAQTVTGSQFLIEISGKRILLECGLYQGRRAESYERNRSLPFNPRKVDAMLLSHAHIDHSGNLPSLVKNGYTGPIHVTGATGGLLKLVLLDSAHIQESDAAYVNKRNARRGKPPVEPLYTTPDAEAVLPLLDGHAYDEPFEVIPGVQATFFEAGHILGSAGICLDLSEHGKRRRLVFSGDIGRRGLPILRDPKLPPHADILMMECTYGDKLHRDLHEAELELRDTVQRTFRRGGKVIVPSFAIGRTQELVYCLGRMIEQGEIPQIPIVVDSPLAVGISDLYAKYPDYFDEEAVSLMKKGGKERALGYEYVTFTRSVDESKALNGKDGPMVIISASGMAESGRILHHLANNIGDPKNMILIVSWQAPYTLGRMLADQAKEVKIFGESIVRQAEVATIGGFSAHAGQNFLYEYAKAAASNSEAVFLVHGESKSALPFQEKLNGDNLSTPVYYPGMGDQADFN